MAPIRFESKPTDPSQLEQPLHFPFSKRSAPNRFLKGAMTERLSSWHPTDFSKRGIPGPNIINVYQYWGEGGIGNILTGNIMIDYDQLEAPGNLIIPPGAAFSGPRFEGFRELATQAKKHGSLIIGQVCHPGRQVEDRIQKNPVSASDVQLTSKLLGASFAKPHAATQEEIDKIVEDFVHAAEFLEKAGYDGIQLHAAHGYLLAQFLSERTNHRTDEYSGSLTNRARFITSIAQGIQSRCSPSFILGIKLNSVEFMDKGFQPAEARELVKILESHRFDFVELSGGTYEENAFQHKRESTIAREGFFIEWADQIVPALKETKSYVTGGFRTVGAMVDALAVVDGVGLARPLCSEPDLCKKLLDGRASGALKQLFDENDFLLTNFVAGTQMRQLGKRQQPFDGSDEEAVEGFTKDFKTFMEFAEKDRTLERAGYADLTTVDVVPYVTAAATLGV